MTDTNTTPAPKKRGRPPGAGTRKSFDEFLADERKRREEADIKLALKIAKHDKEKNPELAMFAEIIGKLESGLEALAELRTATGNPELSMEDAYTMLREELTKAAPGLLAQI